MPDGAHYGIQDTAEQEARARVALRSAIASLHRAEDCPRLGYLRDSFLDDACTSLRRAGLPEYAARIEADDSVTKIMDELAAMGVNDA